MKNLLSPQLLAHQGERIGEGRMSLVVPGRPPKGARCLPHPLMGENRVTSENKPNSAGVVLRIAKSDHCLCVSKPRCLPHLLECRLQLPAHDEPGEDLLRIGVKV